MDDNRLPLEQRIGSLRDGDTTDHGTPIGSTPLKVQPPRRPDMDTPHPLGGATSQTPHLLGGDIVELLRTVIATPHGVDIWTTTALEAADEIERLRAQVRSQALELLVAHSEALGLYDITMVCHTPDETDAIRQQHSDYVDEA